jgi:type IV secretory pathway VirB4 component
MNDGQSSNPASPPNLGGSSSYPNNPSLPIGPSGQPPTQAGQSNPGAGKTNPNSTQNSLLISEVRDGIVIMNDGSFRAVVMCKSINFDLMSPQEREAVEFSYQGFLNSLYFPIQIFIRSQKIDLAPYLDKLDKIRSEQDNMLLGLLMEDYVAFLSDISQQTNIMDKKFYVVIQYPDLDENLKSAIKQSTGFFGGLASMLTPNKQRPVTIDEALLENAKTELKNRVQSVMQGLQQCGVQSLPLDTQEMLELYYDAYNPDTATRQQLKDFNDLTGPIVTMGTGNAPQPNLDREVA